MLRALPLLPLFLFALAPPQAVAQDRVDVSTRISYEYGVPLAIERYPGVANRFGFAGFGRSQNHTFQFQGELAIQGMMLSRYDALFRLGMALSTGSFLSNEYAANNAIHSISRGPVANTNRFRIQTSESMARLDALVAFEPVAGVRIVTGPWLGWRLSGSVIQTEELIGPANAIFIDGEGTTRLISAGEELQSNPFRGGALVGVGTRFPLFSRIIVQPEAHARLDIESLWRGLGLRSLSGGIGLGFSLGPELPIADPPPAPVVKIDSATLISTPATTALSVDLYNADASPSGRKVAPVHVGRTHHRTWLSISPMILFEKGSDTLPARYLRASSADSATGDARIFEILAERLRELPNGTITLAGQAGFGESRELVTRRSESVRRHLVAIYGIDPARIRTATRARAMARSGNGVYGSAVEIIPSDPRLLAPVYRQRITRDYSGPRLGLQRRIESPATIRSWTITIRQGPDLIARYTSGNEPPEQIDAVFRVDSLAADSSITPLVAELEVIDINGGTSQVRDELPLRLVGSTEDRDLRSWLFLDPAIGGATAVVNSALLSSITSATRDGARITIAGGRSSGQGEWGAAHLAETILAALNESGIEPAEIHITTDSSAVRFPAPLPNDAIHARAVGVTLRQRAE